MISTASSSSSIISLKFSIPFTILSLVFNTIPNFSLFLSASFFNLARSLLSFLLISGCDRTLTFSSLSKSNSSTCLKPLGDTFLGILPPLLVPNSSKFTRLHPTLSSLSQPNLSLISNS
ncbi:conserved hypothetical protein [Ricinus communis]|uniref:Uncharacterized protein n=1 Tax=Ricinus communis TaxID=3988 RepID=B9RHU8_RICCO|nr:conserved hypothetical protein [Ricinus communis]